MAREILKVLWGNAENIDTLYPVKVASVPLGEVENVDKLYPAPLR